MGKIILILVFVLFINNTYAQIVGITTNQKGELVELINDYDNCREAYEELYEEKKMVEFDLSIQRRINDTFEVENKELIGENAVIKTENKELKSSNTVLKVLSFGMGVLGFYVGTQQ